MVAFERLHRLGKLTIDRSMLQIDQTGYQAQLNFHHMSGRSVTKSQLKQLMSSKNAASLNYLEQAESS